MAEKNSEQQQGEDGNAGEKKKPYDDPSNWEYDCGDPGFTGDIEKLSPHMREVQEQIARDAFGDRGLPKRA